MVTGMLGEGGSYPKVSEKKKLPVLGGHELVPGISNKMCLEKFGDSTQMAWPSKGPNCKIRLLFELFSSWWVQPS